MRVTGNLFAVAPGSREAEVVEVLARGGACRLERIVSRGHATPPGEWYDQDWDEWVVLLRGTATLRFADASAPMEMQPGDFVLIPAHDRHRVEATSRSEDSIWLALHFVRSPGEQAGVPHG